MGDFALGGGSHVFSSGAGTNSQGLTLTSSATADTLGTIVELITSTENDSNSMSIMLTEYTFASAAPVSFLMNIYIGGSGSEVALVENIHFYSDNSAANYSLCQFDFPVRVPSGTRISADVQTDTAAADAVMIIAQFRAGGFQSSRGCSEIVSYGANTATTNGATVDPGATINTKGAWAEVEASTAQALRGFTLSMGSNLNNATDSANWLIDIGVGGSGSEVVIAENIYGNTTGQEKIINDGSFFEVDIPAGSRIAIRAQSEENNVTDRVKSYVFHGAVK